MRWPRPASRRPSLRATARPNIRTVQMYQNHLAVQAHRPLPYPNVEAPSVVAPAWASYHNYGLAADITPANSADYPRMWDMANQFGLTALRQKDMDHFQMSGSLADNVAQYKLAGWRPDSQPAPDQNAIAYSGPAGPSSSASSPAVAAINQNAPPPGQPVRSGASLNPQEHAQFIYNYALQKGVDPNVALSIANAEGLRAWSPSNPNAGSYVDRTNSVKPWSFGDFQLNVRNGLGNQARAAGVDSGGSKPVASGGQVRHRPDVEEHVAVVCGPCLQGLHEDRPGSGYDPPSGPGRRAGGAAIRAEQRHYTDLRALGSDGPDRPSRRPGRRARNSWKHG